MIRRTMDRRLALDSPYSEPSTAEDGLPLPARLAGLYFASIAAVYSLCNAAIGLRTARRFTLRKLGLGRRTLRRRNRVPGIRPVVATLTADRLQQQKRKHIFFEETARAGAICFLSTTFPAVEVLEKPAPRGSGKGVHAIAPGKNILTLVKMQGCGKRAAYSVPPHFPK
jgi:hypothetical protein